MRGGWTYIMASKPRGMLYIGVTAHLAAHCRRFGIRTLVLAEPHETIEDAIAREKRLKAWNRDWKIRLIEESNPDWRDLFDLIT